MKLIEHLEKLNYFCIAYESGSLKQASKKAFRSQPQITRTIKQLEDLFNKKLFIRSSTGVTPTLEGEKLYNFSKNLLQQSEQFDFEMRSLSGSISGNLKVGTYDSISRYFFPDFIKFMKSMMPNLSFTLITGRTKNILKMLNNGEIDIAVVVGKNKSNKLDFTEVYEDHFCFYSIPKLETSYQNVLISFDELLDDLQEIKRLKEYNNFYKCENLETVMGLTLAGLGVGILPTKVVHDFVITGKLKMLSSSSSKKISKHIIYTAKKKELNTKVQVVHEELMRFLELWSKR